MNTTVRVELPFHLAQLAGSAREVQILVPGPLTQRSLLDALEDLYPMLRGTLRDHTSKRRRPFIRFFAYAEDLSHLAPDDPLPPALSQGVEPLLIVAAVAGG